MIKSSLPCVGLECDHAEIEPSYDKRNIFPLLAGLHLLVDVSPVSYDAP